MNPRALPGRGAPLQHRSTGTSDVLLMQKASQHPAPGRSAPLPPDQLAVPLACVLLTQYNAAAAARSLGLTADPRPSPDPSPYGHAPR